MNKYELLETIGEGAYGIVIKAKSKETGQLVAIKRFKESDEDELVRKTTLREVKILRSLKDEPYIVRLLEAFRRKGRLYLVFEYVGKNLLEVLEEHPTGIPEAQLKRMVFTMLLSAHGCHSNGVIHRDIKPENLLVAADRTLRLCDFGFARQYTAGARDLTDYVATRWYRSPELLLGTSDYSLPSDMFASGCIMAELIDGQPLFPGESEIDQMHLIQKLLGPFTPGQMEVFAKNPRFAGHQLRQGPAEQSLERRYGNRLSKLGLDLLKRLLVVDPAGRPTVVDALRHPYFDGLAAELCPQLVPLLTAVANVPPIASAAHEGAPPPRPDTRGGEGGIMSAGARRRSATRSMLPSTSQAQLLATAPHDDLSMPAIGSRPQSRGQQPDVPHMPPHVGSRGNVGIAHGSSSTGLRAVGSKPSPVQTSLHHHQQQQQPPVAQGYGSAPAPYAGAPSAGLTGLRTGSGQRRTGSTHASLPKPASRGDVLDAPPASAEPVPLGGFHASPYVASGGGPSYGGTPAYPSASSAYKPPAPLTAGMYGGNLPRLAPGQQQGLPPSGNGPAPSFGMNGPPHGAGPYAYNSYLGGTRGRQPMPGAGRY